jgi:ABC-type microcin C transport system permease subunit YejE
VRRVPVIAAALVIAGIAAGAILGMFSAFVALAVAAVVRRRRI